MSVLRRMKIENELKRTIGNRTRLDISPGHFDSYFLTLYLLFQIASGAVFTRTGKNAVLLELLQTGLRVKFATENGLITEKIKVYCEAKGLTVKELLEAVSNAIGEPFPVVDQQVIETDRSILHDIE